MQLGCVLCILGSTIIVIHSPISQDQESISTLVDKFQQTPFILYVSFVILLALSIIFHFGPKYGSRNVCWYIILCSAIGSLSVMSCKGLGISMRDILSSDIDSDYKWLPYCLVVAVILCITIQMTYLNRALDLFNTNIVTPVYYVFFTTFVLVASSILFKEWQQLSFKDIAGSVCGFLVIVIAIILLNAFKNVDITVSDIRGVLRPKKDVTTNELNGNLSANLNFSRSI